MRDRYSNVLRQWPVTMMLTMMPALMMTMVMMTATVACEFVSLTHA